MKIMAEFRNFDLIWSSEDDEPHLCLDAAVTCTYTRTCNDEGSAIGWNRASKNVLF